MAVEKFMFNTEFGGPAADPAAVDGLSDALDDMKTEADAARKKAPPPPPTFSKEELEAAKQAGYQEGRDGALAAQEQALEKEIATALSAIAGSFGAIGKEQQQSVATLRRETTAITGTVLGKLFPDLNARHGTDEVVAVITEILSRLIDEPTVIIHVNAAHRDGIAERLASVVRQQGLGIGMEVVADDAVVPGDCRLTWKEGGAERNSQELWREIETIIHHHAGPAPEPAAAADGEGNEE